MKTITLKAAPQQQSLAEADSNALLRQLVRSSPSQVREYMANLDRIEDARELLTALALAVRHLWRNGP